MEAPKLSVCRCEPRPQDYLTVIHTPLPNFRDRLQDQVHPRCNLVFLRSFPDPDNERTFALKGRFDGQLPNVPACALPKEIETLSDSDDAGILVRNFQATGGHELPDHREDLILWNFFRYSAHSQIIHLRVVLDFEF